MRHALGSIRGETKTPSGVLSFLFYSAKDNTECCGPSAYSPDLAGPAPSSMFTVHDNGRYEGPGYFPFQQQPQRTMWKLIPNQIMMPSDPNTIMYSILLLSTQSQIGSSEQTAASRECRIGTIWATMEAQPLHNLFSYEVIHMPSVWKSSTLTKQIDHMMEGLEDKGKKRERALTTAA